jgi:hypothetical protein
MGPVTSILSFVAVSARPRSRIPSRRGRAVRTWTRPRTARGARVLGCPIRRGSRVEISASSGRGRRPLRQEMSWLARVGCRSPRGRRRGRRCRGPRRCDPAGGSRPPSRATRTRERSARSARPARGASPASRQPTPTRRRRGRRRGRLPISGSLRAGAPLPLLTGVPAFIHARLAQGVGGRSLLVRPLPGGAPIGVGRGGAPLVPREAGEVLRGRVGGGGRGARATTRTRSRRAEVLGAVRSMKASRAARRWGSGSPARFVEHHASRLCRVGGGSPRGRRPRSEAPPGGDLTLRSRWRTVSV